MLRLDSADPAHQPSATEPASEPSAPSQTTPTPPPPAVPQDSGSNKSLVPVYVGAGLTVVGLGAWIGFGIDARSTAEDVRHFDTRLGRNSCTSGTASPADCRAANEALDRQRRSAILSNVGLGLSVAAGAATAAYLLFWPRAERETGVSLYPAVAAEPNGGTLILSGAF